MLLLLKQELDTQPGLPQACGTSCLQFLQLYTEYITEILIPRDTLCLEILLSISSRRKIKFPLSLSIFPTVNCSLEMHHWWSINLFVHSPLPVLLQPLCTEKHPNNISLHLTRIKKVFYGRRRAVCPCDVCLAWPPTALPMLGQQGLGMGVPSCRALQQKHINSCT